MASRLFGNVRNHSEEYENAFESKYFNTESGEKETDDRAQQCAKDSCPKFSTVAGIEIDRSEH
jgi:hypothetical protein